MPGCDVRDDAVIAIVSLLSTSVLPVGTIGLEAYSGERLYRYEQQRDDGEPPTKRTASLLELHIGLLDCTCVGFVR
jgi:hypothetical protein